MQFYHSLPFYLFSFGAPSFLQVFKTAESNGVVFLSLPVRIRSAFTSVHPPCNLLHNATFAAPLYLNLQCVLYYLAIDKRFLTLIQ